VGRQGRADRGYTQGQARADRGYTQGQGRADMSYKQRKDRLWEKMRNRRKVKHQTKTSYRHRLQRIRQQTRKMYQTQQNHQSQFLSSNSNTFHSLPRPDERTRGGYKTYYYEKPIPRPSEVTVHKRQVEENHLLDTEVVKSALETGKRIQELGLRILEILKH
jgi:hypothetical protein